MIPALDCLIAPLPPPRPGAAPPPCRPAAPNALLGAPAPTDRLSLALVCKHLFYATRHSGAALWESLSVVFGTAGVLRSFDAWRRRCTCHPRRLVLHVRGAWGLPQWGGSMPGARMHASLFESRQAGCIA